MGAIVTDVGEEYIIKNNLNGVTLSVGVYYDSTDAISDTENLTDITTEPSNSNYSRQSANMSASDLSGDWGVDNDAQLSFDFSDLSTSFDIDSYFIVANFQSTDAGDGSASDNLIITGSLSQSYDLQNVDTLNLNAGGVGVKLD